MNDHTLITALEELSPSVPEALMQDTRNFLSAVDAVAQSNLEEAVPAEMMQMFTDEQWAQLLFEFQPGATLFASDYDVASLHQSWMETKTLVLPEASDQSYWLIFADQEGMIVRMLIPQEYQGLEMAANGLSFSEIASELWSDLGVEKAHHEMTEMLLGWIEDGIIIDAGVPLPDDAEFEKE